MEALRGILRGLFSSEDAAAAAAVAASEWSRDDGSCGGGVSWLLLMPESESKPRFCRQFGRSVSL